MLCKKVFTRTNVCDILSVSKIEGDGMNILKGYVFRMYPTKKQEQLINKTIGSTRFIYNYFLDDKIKEYKVTGKSKSAYDQIKLIPSLSKEYPFLKEVDSCALRNSLFNLEDAYKRFYKGSGYPKFKAKGVHESYKTNNIKSSYKNLQSERKFINFHQRGFKNHFFMIYYKSNVIKSLGGVNGRYSTINHVLFIYFI